MLAPLPPLRCDATRRDATLRQDCKRKLKLKECIPAQSINDHENDTVEGGFRRRPRHHRLILGQPR